MPTNPGARSADAAPPSPDGARIVLCWHMHQPSYLNPATGDYELPWTYLHGIKDYTDMAAHLENAPPETRAVVNFSPILLEQLADYSRQIAGFLAEAQRLGDPLLRALALPCVPASEEERYHLTLQCRRINRAHRVEPHPPFARLMGLADRVADDPNAMRYLSDRFLIDLVTWYHLAWLGETVRHEDARARRLVAKAGDFTLHERRELLALIGELLAGLFPRYRALAEAGRIELAMSPYAHPILPLLQDLTSARESWPTTSLPAATAYPGGAERAHWQLERGLQSFEDAFGHRPCGCWPSEGAISQETLALLQENGFRWTASGGGVLDHSLAAGGQPGEGGQWHRAYILGNADQAESASGSAGSGTIRCFFRDDGLSDAIGFEYADWHGDDAVADLVSRLEAIAAASGAAEQCVIPIIMDGENAWEHYPANGYYFLSGLYERLARHPTLALTTFSDAVASVEPRALHRLVAGSWVYGTLSTWIGEIDKDGAWDLLVAAKEAFDRLAPRLDSAAHRRAEDRLAICESSDWFWWLGAYNPADVVRDFDHLYRVQLAALYHELGAEPPEPIGHAFAHPGEGSPELGGVMRHGRARP